MRSSYVGSLIRAWTTPQNWTEPLQGEAPSVRRVCQFGVSAATFDIADWMLSFADPPLEEDAMPLQLSSVFCRSQSAHEQCTHSRIATINGYCQLCSTTQELEITDVAQEENAAGMKLAINAKTFYPSDQSSVGRAYQTQLIRRAGLPWRPNCSGVLGTAFG